MTYLFFFDVDDTLWDQTYQVHPRTAAAIAAARAAGHKVFINTGRAPGFVPKKLFSQIQTDGSICGLGSTVTIGGETIYRSVFHADDVAAAYEYALREKLDTFIESDGGVFKVGHPLLGIWGVEGEIPDFGEVMKSAEAALVSKIDVAGTLLPCQIDAFERIFGGFYFLQHPLYAEMSPLDCSKAAGMRRTLEYYKANTEIGGEFRTVAIGDSGNDIDMITAADIGVAMGNAPDYVKAAASMLVGSVRDGGAGEAVERVLAGM